LLSSVRRVFQVLVAAFCVSGYSSTYTRAGQKPFNPMLGETYECIREDKGWKFIAEQVTLSHFVFRFYMHAATHTDFL